LRSRASQAIDRESCKTQNHRGKAIPLSSATALRHKADQWKVRLSVSVTAFLIAYTVVATFGSAYVLQDQDTFWHIRTGEWILENATVPTVDTFSHTAYGRPWIANDWLADVIFATAFKVGHWRGVVEITAVAIGAVTAITCFYLTRILRFSVAIGLTTITALFISPHYLARPIIFAYAIMSIWVIILLERYDRDESDEHLPFALIPLMVLWANISGSFTLGLVFLYVFAAYGCYRHFLRGQYASLRRELLMVLAVTASALITPYGIHSALITSKAMSMKFALQNIIEWHSPNFQEHRIHLLYLIGIFSVFAAFGVRLRGPRLPIFMLLMYLGLSYLRGLIMFVLLTPLVAARAVAGRAWYLRAQGSGKTESADPVLHFLHNHAVAIPAGCLVVALVATVANWNLTTVRPPDSAAPQAAIDYAKRAKISGNVFNSYNFGGYLIFSGIPTAIDGRAQPFGDAFMRRYFNAIDLKDIADAFRMLDEYDIDWAILRPAEALSSALGQSATWQKVYSDDHASVFVRLRAM
jgi:hypothetical protein